MDISVDSAEFWRSPVEATLFPYMGFFTRQIEVYFNSSALTVSSILKRRDHEVKRHI